MVQPLGLIGKCSINYYWGGGFYLTINCQVGTFLCVFAMFAMDWITALITMLLTGCLYLYIFYRKPGFPNILSSIPIFYFRRGKLGELSSSTSFCQCFEGSSGLLLEFLVLTWLTDVGLIYVWLFVVDASLKVSFDASLIMAYILFLCRASLILLTM